MININTHRRYLDFQNKARYTHTFMNETDGVTPFKNGLHNIANNCYLNAVMQSFFTIRPFVEKIRTTGQTFGRLVQLGWFGPLRAIISTVSSSYRGVIEKDNTQAMLYKIYEQNAFNFRSVAGQQEDAHEFLMLFIDYMDSVLTVLDNIGKLHNEPPTTSRPIFSDMFNFQVERTKECTVCGEQTVLIETEGVFTVRIDFRELERCLHSHFRDTNIKLCHSCHSQTTHSKTTNLVTVPDVFVVNLDRTDNANGRKNSTQVAIPRFFSLEQYRKLGDDNDHSEFELASVVFHHGSSLHHGHYTALSRNIHDNSWNHFDDLNVQQVSGDRMNAYLNQTSGEMTAYILFYSKIQVAAVLTPHLNNSEVFTVPDDYKSPECVLQEATQDSIYSCNLSTPIAQKPAKRKHKQSPRVKAEYHKLLKKKLRLSQEHRSAGNERNKMAMQRRRDSMNSVEREQVQANDRTRKRISFELMSPVQVEEHKNLKNQYKRNSRKDFSKMIERYEETILEGPDNVCVCCGGLFFRRTLRPFNAQLLESNEEFLDKIIDPTLRHINQKWMCITCTRYVKKGKIPRLALNNGLQFPTVNHQVNNLSELEERLIAPRIAFMKIKPLKKFSDRQMGMVGNVVNVPIDHVEIVKSLPRSFNDTDTIQIRLKRRLDYDRNLMFDTVRPNVVRETLKYLCGKDLFKRNNVNFVDTETGSQDLQDFIVNPDDAEQANRPNKARRVISDDHGEARDDDTILINTENNIGILAPGQNQQPKSVFSDKFAEELTFIKIYGGETVCDYLHNPKYTYQAVCKSEFRRFDRRCAENLNKIFYSFKKLIASRLRSAVEICLQKTRNTENLTVRDALDKTVMDELLIKSEGQLMLRTVRSSPQFWQWKKMELYAMIRQLGCPTLFITFSPSECDWLELITICHKVCFFLN